jgi:ribosomal protein S18 acetylase RimI-like enzyme
MAEAQAAVTATADEDRAIATLTTAFANDAVTRWVLRDAHLYVTYWPKLIRAFAGEAFANGTADATDDHGGVALWLPPGVSSDDEMMGALAVEAIPEGQQEEIFTFMMQMAEFHPKDPHWYLPLIGVDPMMQGRGHGSALLVHALERCDRDHVPAYLEASSPRNKALYERHGFEVTGVIQAGSSPPMWPMLRAAR